MTAPKSAPKGSEGSGGGGSSGGEEEDELEEEEGERLKDIKQRDEFAERLKRKDKDKTRQIMSKSEQKVCTVVMGR